MRTILKNKSISVHESLVRSLIFYVLQTLIELHSQNIIHRDIQPEHILIETDSDKKIQKVALCGFLLSEFEGYSIKNDNNIILPLNLKHHLGINFENNGKTDPSIDLYGFGLSLFEFIFNEKYVNGYSENKLRKSVLSPGMKRIIESMLILDPKKLPEASEIWREYISLSPIPPIETKPNIMPYKLSKELGSGSFGRVFFAENSSNNSQYAIKVIKPEHLHSQDEYDLISQEIEILYELKGLPFIVQYEESFYAEDELYIVTEFCNGLDLFTFIEERGKIGKVILKEEVQVIAYDIASAIFTLHRKSFIHRDLKPQNILLIKNKEGRIINARLADFGTAIKKEGEKVAGIAVGSNNYLAPEVQENIHSVVEYTDKVDVWCYGLILFYLLYKIEFYSFCKSQHIEQINIIPTFPKISSSMNEFVELCKKCLQIDKTARPLFDEILEKPPFSSFKFKVSDYPLYENLKELTRGQHSILYMNKSQDMIIKEIPISSNPNDNLIPEYKLYRTVEILKFSKNCKKIIELDDYYRYENKLYLVQKFCNGRDLISYLDSNKRLAKRNFDLNEIKIIAKDIGEAVQFLHSKAILHRNIQPSNIFLNVDKEKNEIIGAKLGGFMSCRQFEIKGSWDNLISSLSIWGSNEFNVYQAPEISVDSKISNKSDIWGIGLTLLYMTIGKEINEYDPEGANNITKEKKYTIKNINDIDPTLLKLINKCISEEKSRMNIEEFINSEFFKSI